MTDTITPALIAKLRQRAAKGLHEYGVSLSDAPLTKLDVLVHLQEELLDAAAYLQRLIDEERQGGGSFW